MSLALTTAKAITMAQRSLGDLVKQATFRSVTGRTYTAGQYVNEYTDVPVDVIVDKFSFHEQQMENYQQTDIKLVIFNPKNDLAPKLQDRMVWGGKELLVIQADPVYVGAYCPVWTVVLRQ